MSLLVPEAGVAALQRLIPADAVIHAYAYARRTMRARLSRRAGLLDDAQLLDRTVRTDARLPWAELRSVWFGADVQLNRGEAEALLARAPGLRTVYWQRTGLDGLPVSTFESRGIRVVSARDLTSGWVAETIIACITADAKFVTRSARDRVPALDRFTREFATLRVTIVGTGHIGTAVATLASALGMRVTGLTREPQRNDADRSPFAELRRFPDDLLTTARESDYLVLALPSTGETRGVIDAAVLRALGPEGVLVNLARPDIVDQPAMLDALRSGELGAAYISRLDLPPTWIPRITRLPENLFLTHNREAHVAGKIERAAAQFAALL